MSNYAWVESGIVKNVIVWDGKEKFPVGDEVTLVPMSPGKEGGIGDGYDYSTGEFINNKGSNN
ncbi:TPA: hypothetical protein ACKP17_000741 [Serratia marcescens]